MKNVVIIDYFSGNIASVTKAFEFLDCSVKVQNDSDNIKDVDYLVLPGVGAFGDGMARLRSAGFIAEIHEFVRLGRPFLGICLGMQMLLTSSEEFGLHEGLDLIRGSVTRLPASQKLKIPHIGWSHVSPNPRIPDRSWNGTLLDGYASLRDFYFIHSFAARTEQAEETIGVSHFGDYEFASVVCRGNVMGTQFHPEKSKEAGMLILRNFLKL